MKIKAVVHEVEEGGFWAEVPTIPGCATEGETIEEVMKNLPQVIETCLSGAIVPSKRDTSERVVELVL